jgi:tetratricopeptide (TPR) repeat protein
MRIRFVLPARWRAHIRSVLLLTSLLDIHPLTVAGQELDGDQYYEVEMTKGHLRFSESRYEDAAKLFAAALKHRPDDPEASYHLAQTLLRLKMYAYAEPLLTRLVEHDQYAGRAWLGLGIIHYYLTDYQKALTTLAKAEASLSDEPFVYYYQGLTLNKLGQYGQAQIPLAKALQIGGDLSADIHYQSGVAYLKEGAMDEAKAEFNAVIQAEPQSDLARSASELMHQMRESLKSGHKRWHLHLSVAEQFDSNVVLLPGGTSPPGGSTGISRKDDFRTAISARGSYDLVQDEHWTAGLTYSFYQSFHRSLSLFDIQDHSPTVFVQRNIGRIQARFQYVYDQVEVGRAPYLVSHAAQSIVTVSEGSFGFTQFQFRYQDKDFRLGKVPFNTARDGKNTLAGITHFYPFAQNKGSVRVGYTYDTDRTGGGGIAVATPGDSTNADWAYTGHRVSSGLELPPIHAVRLDLAFDYYRQAYDNPNSFSPDGTTVRLHVHWHGGA